MTVFASSSVFSRKIARMLVRGVIGLLMLSHALFAFSSAISLSHDPLRACTHAHAFADADTGQDDHGHRHDDFEDEGGPHQHGHNPADHSHDKPHARDGYPTVVRSVARRRASTRLSCALRPARAPAKTSPDRLTCRVPRA